MAALGVLAYVTETLLHEAAGHGTLCVLTGGQVILIAPLYMQCTITKTAIVAAGPAMNVLAGAVCFMALLHRRERADGLWYFLWLGMAFNWLVAAGYLLVGAVTTFGDWGQILSSVHPNWIWRLPAGLIASFLYVRVLALAGRAFVAESGLTGPSTGTRLRLFIVPTASAAVVAILAELPGHSGFLLRGALAIGCTLGVGWSLTAAGGKNGEQSVDDSSLRIEYQPVLVGIAAGVALLFIFGVGFGLGPGRT